MALSGWFGEGIYIYVCINVKKRINGNFHSVLTLTMLQYVDHDVAHLQVTEQRKLALRFIGSSSHGSGL